MNNRLTRNQTVACSLLPVAAPRFPVAHDSLIEINITNRVNY